MSGRDAGTGHGVSSSALSEVVRVERLLVDSVRDIHGDWPEAGTPAVPPPRAGRSPLTPPLPSRVPTAAAGASPESQVEASV